MAGPNRGALAALALAGLAYFFKNRRQVTGKMQQLGDRVQNQLGQSSAPSTTTTNSEPRAYTGETTRM